MITATTLAIPSSRFPIVGIAIEIASANFCTMPPPSPKAPPKVSAILGATSENILPSCSTTGAKVSTMFLKPAKILEAKSNTEGGNASCKALLILGAALLTPTLIASGNAVKMFTNIGIKLPATKVAALSTNCSIELVTSPPIARLPKRF